MTEIVGAEAEAEPGAASGTAAVFDDELLMPAADLTGEEVVVGTVECW